MSSPQDSVASPTRRAMMIVTLAVAYFIAARLGFLLAIAHPNATAVWAPTGIAMAACIRAGYGIWPAVFIGAFAANATTGVSVAASLGIATGNTLEALLGAWFVARFARGTFDRPRDVLSFTVFAGLVSTAVSPAVGVTSLALGGLAPWAGFPRIWLNWWLGDVGGAMVVAPMLLLLDQPSDLRWTARRIAEAMLLFLAVMVAGEIVFGVPFGLGGVNAPLSFLFFTPVAWVAFRLDSRATAVTVFLIAVLSIWGTLRGLGPFAIIELEESLPLLQAFLAVTSATGLAVAAGIGERRRTHREAAGLNVELSDRVSERTAEVDRIEALLREARALRAEAEASEGRARFLADASTLLSSTLDYQTTLASLASLAVPRIADWCSIQLLEEGGAIEQIALAHVHPEKIKEVQELADRYPPDPKDPYGVHQVIRTGQGQLVPELTDEILVQTAKSPQHLAFLRSLNLLSYMIVPLSARGRTLGAITFVTTKPGRTYTESDMQLARELARRAAIAVENSRLFAQAQEAVRVREDFLSIAAHELRTPVTAVRLQVQIVERALAAELAKAESSPTDAAAGFKMVLSFTSVLADDTRRLVRLIDGLLDATRMSTGRLDLQLEDLDFRDAVKSGIDAMRPEFMTHRAVLSFVSPEPLPGRWDPLRIAQVVANLISNAVKYGEGRPVSVQAGRIGDEVVLTVEDQGRGVDPAFAERMFDRFEQASPGAHGLGLGLYITKQIVESHGGSIAVTSTPGKGAKFTVRLPRITSPARTTPTSDGKP